MRLSTPLKAIVGIATGVFVLLPVMGFALMLVTFLSVSRYEAQGITPPDFFQFGGGAFFAAICVVILLQYPLIAFYVAHIIMNSAANDVARVVLALGVFFVPYVIMPIYFILSILMPNPPSWALKPALPTPNPP